MGILLGIISFTNMKSIAALLFVMLAGQASAVTKNNMISCEQTGGCAGAPISNNKGFVAPYDASDLYSYGEQDNIQREIAEAKQYMNIKKQEEKLEANRQHAIQVKQQ